MAEIIRIHPDNPSERQLLRVLQVLQEGGVIIVPTDTVYSFACDLLRPKAIERMARIKGLKQKEHDFSIIFNDLSHLSHYTKPIDNSSFKVLKRCLPGPFTFILEAGNAVPKLFYSSKKTIGIRIPLHPTPTKLVEMLDRPLVVSSVHDPDDEVLEYATNPELIDEKFGKQVDLIVDGGLGDIHASTVVDLRSGSAEVLREGKGDIALLG